MINPVLNRNSTKLKPILLPCNAGLFDFSVTNCTVKWVFPDGRVSFASRPAFTLDNYGVVKLYAKNISRSNVEINDNGTDVRFLGRLLDFQGKLTNFLILSSCSQMTGSLADLQGRLASTLILENCSQVIGNLADLQGRIVDYLILSNCTQVMGSLADLQAKITNTLGLYNCPQITGSLADLQAKITNTLGLYNCPQVTGSLADLQGKITGYLDLSYCNFITGEYLPIGTGTPSTTILTETGLSISDMDNTLINYANATIPKSNGEFIATGKNRSIASDTAVTTLLGRGWTISGLIKI